MKNKVVTLVYKMCRASQVVRVGWAPIVI